LAGYRCASATGARCRAKSATSQARAVPVSGLPPFSARGKLPPPRPLLSPLSVSTWASHHSPP
jgi:hypothetical protein